MSDLKPRVISSPNTLIVQRKHTQAVLPVPVRIRSERVNRPRALTAASPRAVGFLLSTNGHLQWSAALPDNSAVRLCRLRMSVHAEFSSFSSLSP